jgi:hypothetical protein
MTVREIINSLFAGRRRADRQQDHSVRRGPMPRAWYAKAYGMCCRCRVNRR